MAGMYEKFAPVIHRDGLSLAALVVAEDLATLVDSGSAQYLVVTGGLVANKTAGWTVPTGGTGLSVLTPYSLLAGGVTTTGSIQQISGVGTSGQVLTSNGTGTLPTWQNSTTGVSTFITLTDAPASYAGQALKVVTVNAGETALVFTTLAGGGDALTGNPLSQFAATTSLQLKGVISDETGSGALVFADTPTLVTPLLGTPTSGVLTNCTGLPAAAVVAGSLGTGAYVMDSSLQVVTIELGHATDTTLVRVSAGVISVEGKNVYLAGGTDVAVTDGGTGLSTISALSIWVANSANVVTEVTPGAGKSIRINAGGTAWEAFTPSAGGVTEETPVGSVDGVNATFTVSNTPKFVIIDGMFRVSGQGYTYSAPTITVDATIPPVQFIRSFY